MGRSPTWRTGFFRTFLSGGRPPRDPIQLAVAGETQGGGSRDLTQWTGVTLVQAADRPVTRLESFSRARVSCEHGLSPGRAMYSLVPRQGSARGPRGSMIAFRGALRRGVKWPWSVGLPGGIDMTVRDRRFGGGIYNARGRASSRGGASGHPKRACASPGVELNLALKPPQLRLQSMINGWRGRVGRKPPGGRATRGRSFPLKGPATARTAPQIYSGGRTSVGQYYWRKIHVRPVWGGGSTGECRSHRGRFEVESGLRGLSGAGRKNYRDGLPFPALCGSSARSRDSGGRGVRNPCCQASL